MSIGLRQLPCIYCGQVGDEAPDHVPPRSLFPIPLPNDLQTVPSCQTCNRGFQPDDDYIHATLAFRINAQMNPQVQSVRARALRGLDRPEAAGFARSVFSNLVASGRTGTDGFFQLAGQVIEGDRVARFVKRLTRAYFFVERSRVLRTGHRVAGGLFEAFTPMLRGLLPTLGNGGGVGERAAGQFEYVWGEASDDPDTTVWLFTLFDRFSFLGATAPPRE